MKGLTRFAAVLAALTLSANTFAQVNDWANTARYYEANKAVTASPKAVFMGDSITDGWAAQDAGFFTSHNYAGRGISGQTTCQMLVRFRQDVINLKPKYVVILAGTNDIAQNIGPISHEAIVNNIISMCELAKAHKIKVVICSILPVYQYVWRPEIEKPADQIMEINAQLREYAKANKFTYLDYHSAMKDDRNGLPAKLSTDGCHPTKEGYAIMEEMVTKVLK